MIPKNEGYYEKYNVFRKDGKPVGRTFTIEIDRDPQAVAALEAYVKALKANNNTAPLLQRDLKSIIRDLRAVNGDS